MTRRDLLLTLAGGAVHGLSASCAPRTGNTRREIPEETLGVSFTEQQLAAGVAFLRRYPSVDVHSHPGLFFLRDAIEPTSSMLAFGEPFEQRATDDLRAGRVSAALFAGVADVRLLEVSRTGIRSVREFGPGEAWSDYLRQLNAFNAMASEGAFALGDSPDAIIQAHNQGKTAAVFSVEGGDFFEDRLERVARVYADGVRAVTIVHYHTNQLGDIQTAESHHGGLTALGADIVREMNRVGIIVDLAHATHSVTRGALDASTKPMMISHTNLQTADLQHPRLVTLEHARLVTSHGGIIGSVPWGIGQSSFGEWIDSILHLVDAVGIDHVGIGTDMDANFAPVFSQYRLWHLIPTALLARGMSEIEVAKVLGRNFIRIYEANQP